jgi:hypothetical protein
VLAVAVVVEGSRPRPALRGRTARGGQGAPCWLDRPAVVEGVPWPPARRRPGRAGCRVERPAVLAVAVVVEVAALVEGARPRPGRVIEVPAAAKVRRAGRGDRRGRRVPLSRQLGARPGRAGRGGCRTEPARVVEVPAVARCPVAASSASRCGGADLDRPARGGGAQGRSGAPCWPRAALVEVAPGSPARRDSDRRRIKPVAAPRSRQERHGFQHAQDIAAAG